ncbi:MAG: diguanylate cyclase [Gemmatimonadetes bacterium]|jgi:diguanylate cyclase (GGDEF)-like protein/PAS domain S-box-containing protein|nr:diguanylate cyclase [Gemmatimonadota bacterium]
MPRRFLAVSLALTFAALLVPAARLGAQRDTPPRSTIAEVVANEGRQSLVTIAGRASVGAGKLQATVFDIAVQDATGGMRVFSRTRRENVHEGDSIVVTGRPQRYRGDLELVATSVHVIPGAPRPIEPRELPVMLSRIGRYTGQLVRVHGRVLRTGYSEGGQWLQLRGTASDSPDSLTVWVPANHGAPIVLAKIQPNDSIVATGIVAAYRDNPEDPIVWQLLPRDTADVRISSVPLGIPDWLIWGILGGTVLIAGAAMLGRFIAHRQLSGLRETEARYRQLLELSPDAVIVHAGGSILFTNASAAQLLGAATEQELVGRPLADLVDADSRAALERAPASAAEASAPRIRARLLPATGGAVDVEVTSSRCVYHDQPAVVMLARDISAQLRYERDLHALALVDELTGLKNRRGFTLFAEQELARARRYGRTPVLVFADVDGLKQINDEHGHSAGDAALRHVAIALKSILREADIVARWSGDEFVALMGEGGEAGAGSIGERLDAALAAQAPAGQPYSVRASVGTSTLDPGLPLAEALERADAELYAKKKSHRTSGPTATSAVAGSGESK